MPQSLNEQPERRRSREGEHRLPPAVAVVVAGVTYLLLPGSLHVGPRFAVPVVEALLLVALLVVNPVRMNKATWWSRRVSIALAALIIVTNLGSLAILVTQTMSPKTGGGPLLAAAMQVWVTNVIGFALLYWELDRGGPVARRKKERHDLPPADWRFSQDENADAVVEVRASSSKTSGWVPVFVDYAYLSVTNSSAFSPTDTMPLSSRAKTLMAVQATSALLVSLLIVARAIGAFGG